MTTLFQSAQAVLQAQPFSQLLGTELTTFEGRTATLRLPVKDTLKQQFGFVHGGVLSYLADNALTFAGGLVLGPAVVTSEFKINYLRPAIGQVLVARATVLHAGRNQAVCRCDILVVAEDGQEQLCAVAQGTIAATAHPQAHGAPDEPA